MSDLTFTRPELWPWLLAFVPTWLALWWVLRARRDAAREYGAVFRERVTSPAGRATRLALAAGFLFVVFMEPRYGEEQVQIERRGLDIIFALDTSRSMLARDIAPHRLGAAKRDIVSVLPDLKGGDRAALVAFAGEARVVVPLTHDLDSFRGLLEPVGTDTIRKGGSDLNAAIRRSLQLSMPSEQATTVIVMLTDGEDLTGASQQAAREAASRGVVIHAIGYGSAKGSKITLEESGKESFLKDDKGVEVVSTMQSDWLRTTVEATGGEFLRSEVMTLPLRQLKEKRLDPLVKRIYESGEESVFKTRFQWALIPAMLLLSLELFWIGGSRR